MLYLGEDLIIFYSFVSVLFFRNEMYLHVYPEVVDVAEVFKREVELVAVQVMERSGEIFILIGWEVNTFIPRLTVVTSYYSFIPIARVIHVCRQLETSADTITLKTSANSSDDVPDVSVRNMVFVVNKSVVLLLCRLELPLISQVALDSEATCSTTICGIYFNTNLTNHSNCAG